MWTLSVSQIQVPTAEGETVDILPAGRRRPQRLLALWVRICHPGAVKYRNVFRGHGEPSSGWLDSEIRIITRHFRMIIY